MVKNQKYPDKLLNIPNKLLNILGKDRVTTDENTLKNYSQKRKINGKMPQAIVRPLSTDEVKQLVDLARAEQLNLVTVSSSVTRPDGIFEFKDKSETIIIDMSGMNRIVLVDRRNKAALIEPGVTFSQLINEADKSGLKVHMPLLPPEGKSVLASYLEREPIQIPKYHWDMTDPLLCSEFVFGTGKFFRTGSAAGPGSLEQQRSVGVAQVNPLGPGQCDLMKVVQGAQGTMGVATWGTVKLEVKPDIHLIRFLPDHKLTRLVNFAYKALKRKLCDEFFILNAQALATVISDKSQNPCEIAQKQAPYTLVFGISGYEYFPEERVAYQEKDLAKIAQKAGVEIMKHVPGCSGKKMGRILSCVSSAPSYKACVKGDFLNIFFLTTLDRTQSFINIMECEAGKQAISMTDIGVYLQPIQQGRAVHVEFTIYYNPNSNKESKRAEQLFKDASKALNDNGAFFSRPYGDWADLAYSKCPDTVSVLKKVKKMLDPDDVLNRGKLCFQEVA